MKKIILLFSLSLLVFSAAFTQTSKKLVVMVTRANWCPTCRANEGKIKNELIPAYSSSKDVLVVINDVTNKRTKNKAKPLLQSAGVYEIAQKEQATGVISLINPLTGKTINRIYVSYSLAEIKKAIEQALPKS